MMRRVLGPVGGPIVFFLVAALVFAVLGWVTDSALRVERAQREAAARAELGNNLRIALWRLDVRLLPTLSVEDGRPFYHYSPVNPADPAENQLIAANLPNWMKLHFQLDPQSGWCSPQVLDSATANVARQAWGDDPRNLSTYQCAALDELKKRYPARETLELFAANERALPPDAGSLAVPFVSNTIPIEPDPLGLQFPNGDVPNKPAPPFNNDSTANSINNTLVMGNGQNGTNADAEVFRMFGWELCVRNDLQAGNLNQKKGLDNAQAGNTSGRGFTQAPGAGLRGGRMGQKDNEGDKQVADWLHRYSVLDRALREAKQAAEHTLPKGQMLNSFNQNYSQGGDPRLQGNVYPNPRQQELPPIVPGAGGQQPGPPSPVGGTTNPPGGAPGPGSYLPLTPAEIVRLANGGRIEGPLAFDASLAQKAGEQELRNFEHAAEFELLRRLIAIDLARFGLALAEIFAVPSEAHSRRALARWARSGLIDPSDKELGTIKPFDPATSVPPGEERPAVPPAALQPLAIHLGSMRPQWVTAPDGTEMLVLVRAARVDGKTVYQGVVVDWAKLESALREEVKDLFPEAALTPVKDFESVSPDRAMTTLPVQLDPGPEPPLAPAGWTPLRLGLVLSWIAALIAFAAVGFAGWSLIDLAERRIRFVSAVTHELRTPLTSLRLYLDLLVSGMIQDEAKRQEYLGTLAVESDRLHRLIDNVLDFAKLEKRKKNGDVKPVNVNDVLDQVRQTWTDRVALDAKELVVISTVPAARHLSTDAAMIQQIVGNLVDNARKYSRDAADKRIWVWAKPGRGDGVVIEVEDRGPGVPAGERKTIFKPFRRGAVADSTSGGAGLGLALAKSWAEVLGGRLSYRPADGGVGACFRLELPGK